jgi:uncharacterized protein YfeS
MEDSGITRTSAHPNAQALLKDDFYWNPIEETGPFGNDDGADAFVGLREWRRENKSASPVMYFIDLLSGWGYAPFNWGEMDIENIKTYMAANKLGLVMLVGHDNAIIAIAFGQFALEGKIDEDVRLMAKTAIKRQMLPVLIEQFMDNYIATRRQQLEAMLVALDAMNN